MNLDRVRHALHSLGSFRRLFRCPDGHALLKAVSFALAAASLMSSSSSAQVYFRPGPLTPGSCSLWGKAVADFDGDGHLDAALPAYEEDAVSVFLGRGDGTFQHLADHAVGDQPHESAAADFDQDGNADVAVTGSGSDDVTILLGDGSGSFGSVSSIPVRDEPTSIIAADLNGDGHFDIGITERLGVTLLFGNGTGTFPAARAFELGSPGSVFGLAAADLNGDGLTDIVVGSYDGFVLLADGAGGFVQSMAGFCYFWPVVADLNGDARLELVTATYAAIFVWTANGPGSFEPLWRWDLGAGPLPQSVHVADLDEDGFADVVSAFYDYGGGSGGGLAVALTDSDARPKWQRFLSAGGPVFDAVARDLDEDGHADFLIVTPCGIVPLVNVTFAWLDALRGNVNAASGAVTPVLCVNGSSGTGTFEPMTIDLDDPLTISVDAPPSRPRARFVMYAWPVNDTVPYRFLELPFGLGASALPTPLLPREWPQPRRVANNLGYGAQLGVDNWPGPALPPAPAVLLDLPNGLGRSARFFLQGFIMDSAAPNGQAAVTNGIDLSVH